MNQDRDADIAAAEQGLQLTLGELSRQAGIEAEQILAMVEEGIIEPLQEDQRVWYFSTETLYRVATVIRLQRDLQINLAGAALALQLLDELTSLRSRVQILEQLLLEEGD
ncbi:MAG: chaperone modulator CbpM [Gammaproteobacteria bacterium]